MDDEGMLLDLIQQHHISGVVLKASNDNFTQTETIQNAHTLISELQQAEAGASEKLVITDPQTGRQSVPVFIPLFVAISQEGNGPPFSEIMDGLSPIPSQMAIGATWDPDMARAAGGLLGWELQAVGFNLLLGPSLDVLEDPRLIGTGDLGIRSFGGDPYWVSILGGAFIEGLHDGSEGRLGVIAKHFPGLGGGDRPPSDEVATVRKSLTELQQFELVPFMYVAQDTPGVVGAIADGFFTSNIRYQGFQGNIRATTRPVSLDRDAYDHLMSLEGLTGWRESGGITMSDSLGSRAIRRFLDSLGENYKAHLVAKDAFLAGNDLLYLADSVSSGDPDEATTVRSTLAFFAQKYREDAVFAQRVDEAVLRILKLKLRMYDGVFDIERVIPPVGALDEIGQNFEVAEVIASHAAGLISPFQEQEIEESFGRPPVLSDRIVFLTDTRYYQQCSVCDMQEGLSITGLEDSVLRLYGPGVAGQIGGWNLSSYSLADLANSLGEPAPGNLTMPLVDPEVVAEDIQAADWLIFSILRSTSDVYGSGALKLLLDTRPDWVFDKRIVVFSHDVPYELDATDISKIDLYYAMYSKSPPFIEFAARLLFQEVSAESSPPISVPGIGYDLIEATSPAQSQIIALSIPDASGGETGDELEQKVFMVGETVTVQTGVILDNNGHPVPDSTPVEFIIDYQGENIPPLRLEAVTHAGKADVMLTIDRPGALSIRAESLPARNSDLLTVTALGDELGTGTIFPPTPKPAPVETDAPEETLTLTPESTPGSASHEEQGGGGIGIGIGWVDLGYGLMGLLISTGAAYAIASARKAWYVARLRWWLATMIGALLGYDYLALGLPGAEEIMGKMGAIGAFVFTVVGGLIVVLGLILRDLIMERSGSSTPM